MRSAFKRIMVWLLVTTLPSGIGISSFAQTQNAVGGGANGASVNVSATVLGVPSNVSVPFVAPVSLPPQGGSATDQVASVNVSINPGVLPVLSTGLIINTTSGIITQTSAHAESTSTVNTLNLLNGLVTATTIRSKSTSDGNGTTANSSSAGSFANQLRIAGVLYQQSEFDPNTEVAVSATVTAIVGGLPVLVPLNGTVIINEQIRAGNGQTTSSLTVNFLHVNVSGSVAGLITLNANIIVASASSGVDFTAASGGNNPPTLNVPGSQTVQAGTTLTFNVSGSDTDAGDIVTLSASNVPSNAGFNQTSGNPASGQFGFTPVQSQSGQTFTVNFSATDNHGASVSRSVQINVTPSSPPANNPPIISVPGPQVIGVGQLLTFTVTASDPDGDAVTISATSVPPNATFNPSTGGFAFNPTSIQAGQVFVVTFTATDSRGASASGTVQITVTNSAGDGNPQPPIISVPPSPIIIPVGQELTFVVTGTSAVPGCVVRLSSSGNPDHSQFEPFTGRFRFIPTSDQQDKSFVVTFTATDCIALSASATVTIMVVSPVGGVLGPGRICVPITKLTFGATGVNGGCGFVTVSITNGGAGNLTINSLKLEDGRHFRVEGLSNMPLVLKSAAVLEMKIMFQPRNTGPIVDVLTIQTSDPENPTMTIALKGKGANF